MPDMSPRTPILIGAADLSCAIAAEVIPQSNKAQTIDNGPLDIDVSPSQCSQSAPVLAAKISIGRPSLPKPLKTLHDKNRDSGLLPLNFAHRGLAEFV